MQFETIYEVIWKFSEWSGKSVYWMKLKLHMLFIFYIFSLLPFCLKKKKKDNSVVRTSELAEAQVQLSLSQNVKILGTSLSKSAE